ncbi:MAG: MarR family transcriptional regulator [Rhodobacteraceae bacterium]|nr:MarR family transcriptional regulator [Paracoccaceae bacterium]
MARARQTDNGPDPDRADPATPLLEEFVGYNLKRAYVAVQNDFRRALGDDGLAPRTFSALSLVVQYPDITQSALARMLGIERSGLVAIVDDLERRGLIRRTDVPGDRRAQALVPTAAGRGALAEAVAAVRAHEDAMLADFTATDRATLIALLRRIRARGG